jgi:hypothetical protein
LRVVNGNADNRRSRLVRRLARVQDIYYERGHDDDAQTDRRSEDQHAAPSTVVRRFHDAFRSLAQRSPGAQSNLGAHFLWLALEHARRNVGGDVLSVLGVFALVDVAKQARCGGCVTSLGTLVEFVEFTGKRRAARRQRLAGTIWW